MENMGEQPASASKKYEFEIEDDVVNMIVDVYAELGQINCYQDSREKVKRGSKFDNSAFLGKND